ncbi:MAG: preprotein translocase subunit SecA [Deltaproteobacteria bacterium]|nr:preprotein translocase subunit SecA [Deltaproteobacteria bacterium]
MFKLLLTKIFGSKNERELRRLWPIVETINNLEPKYQGMLMDDLRAQTADFKNRAANGESLDALLPEAFAVVRETSRRVLGMRHFDVQLLGGIVLHEGKIAEMKTGEGKTLCATLPLYLNALSGKGAHLVTVNDYLARRDAEWMGRIYRSLDMTVGVVVNSMEDAERRIAYGADITYGQNNEFGFDYLRDNMKPELAEMAQRGHNFAIVDEVDSILIDEARTPLIISGPSANPTETYGVADKIVKRIIEDNNLVIRGLEKQGLTLAQDSKDANKTGELFFVDLKGKQVMLNDAGVHAIEQMMKLNNLYAPENIELVHHVTQALKAHITMKRDVDYIVRDQQVVIVDEFTGRQMEGRRWSDGLHQAVEAKESVPIARESETLGKITFQNYFRMYKKLGGMTGTADTEAVEFKKIYNLDVVVVPTNMPMVRTNYPDVIFVSQRAKYKAACDEIEELHEKGQPILVGTTSIEASELISALLQKRGIKHHVLNAKHHEREAEIIAQAGRFNAVTISTNMAGRGTDILLGGNSDFMTAAEGVICDPLDTEFNAEKYKERISYYKQQCEEERKRVVAAGGLHVMGTERHESRRIDNQLRGRSGRQGDPGSSQFYVSLEDDLMKRFGGDRLQAIMSRVGMTDEDAVSSPIVAHAIENAQKKVEGYHFDIRKHLLEYDDVLNRQREVVYTLRNAILRSEEIEEHILTMVSDVVENMILSRVSENEPTESWDVSAIFTEYNKLFGLSLAAEKLPSTSGKESAKTLAQNLFDHLSDEALRAYEARKAKFGAEMLEKLSRFVHLQGIDYYWKEHLTNMEHLSEGISMRAYGQKNPLHEYQKESFELFTNMMSTVSSVVLANVFNAELLSEEEIKKREEEEFLRRKKQAETAKSVHEDVIVAKSAKPAPAQGGNRQQRRAMDAQSKKGKPR